ncbi:hypothetical protein TNCV_3826581 [Trichonephila clavipes]|nr:hypothetical protein TNCV_3826581 [Trichonephila clavipes]
MVDAVVEWSRYRIVAGLVMSSRPVPLRTRHVRITPELGSSFQTFPPHQREFFEPRPRCAVGFSGIQIRNKQCNLRARDSE